MYDNAERFALHLGDSLEILRAMPDNSIDAIVTDPPYGLGKEPDALAMLRDWIETGHHDVKGAGFMGKAWDAFVPQPILWAECLRVLKPGGHLVAFAGTRTQDLMALGLRIAGFEIRDLLAWLYGSGFPKSLDVSKAIDKTDAADERRARALRFTAWLRSTGITSAQIDFLTGSCMGGHYLTASSQPQVATREHFEAIRPALCVDVPDWVESMIDQRTVESENFKRREVVARVEGKDPTRQRLGMPLQDSGATHEFDITAPATDAARDWQGWGTALKPALEPITLARKPLDGTVAANVLRWRTGAVNVDGCRVKGGDTIAPVTGKGIMGGSSDGWDRPWKSDPDAVAARQQRANEAIEKANTLGRWPANLLHDGSPDVLAGFPDAGGGTGGTVRRGVGVLKHGGDNSRPQHADDGGDTVRPGYADSGSAARFFYCAKASRADRDEGLGHLDPRRPAAAEFRPNHAEKAEAGDDGNPYGRWSEQRNIHPTVKPTNLMRWLCRLITPPGGVILDPFMGSGSTGKAAMFEGFRFVGIDITEDYFRIASARIAAAANGPTADDLPEPDAPEPDNDNAAAPAVDLFKWGGV